MIKAAVDTDIFISSLLDSSNNRAIINALKEFKFELIISSLIFEEIQLVAKRPKFHGLITKEAADELIEVIKEQAVFVKLSKRINLVSDLADNELLNCAIAAKADLIVTGDKELLLLKPSPLPIISPKEFLKYL